MTPRTSSRFRWKRLLGIALGSVVAVAALALALHPWLVAGILAAFRPVAGLDFGEVEARGYRALEFSSLRYEGPVVFSAGRVEVPLPWGWWRAEPGETVLEVEQWVLEPGEAGDGAAETGPGGPVPIFRQVLQGFEAAAEYLPGARLTDGRIELTPDPIPVSELTWDGTALRLEGRVQGLAVEGRVSRPGPERLALSVQLPERSLQLEVAVGLSDGTIDATADFRGWDGRAEGSASWGEGWLPRDAEGRIRETFVLPSIARLEALEVGAGRFQWSEGTGVESYRFASSAEGRVRWATEERGSTEAAWALEAAGEQTRERWRVNEAAVRLPFLEAALTDPVAISREDWTPRAPSTWRFAFDGRDFEPLGWPGRFSGRLVVSPARMEGLGRALGLQLEGEGHLPEAWAAEALQLDAQAQVRPERLRLEVLRARAEDGSRLEAAATLAIPAQRWEDGRIEARIKSRWLRLALPELPEEARAETRLTFSGALGTPTFEGNLRAEELAFGPVPPLSARLEVSGETPLQPRVAGEIRRGPQRVELAAGLDLSGGGGLRVALERLRWSRPGADEAMEAWVLQEPTRLSLGSAGTWSLDFGGLAMHRPGAGNARLEIAPLQWSGSPGAFQFTLAQADTSWLEPWTEAAVPAVAVELVEVAASPLSGQPWWEVRVRVQGRYEETDFDLPFDLRLEADADGLRWQDAAVAGLLRSQGRLPLRVGWEAGPQWEWLAEGPLDGVVRLREIETVPGWLTDLTGVEGQDLRAEITFDGSPSAPRGTLKFKASQVSANTLPVDGPFVLHALEGRLRVDPTSLRIEELQFRYGDRPATTVEAELRDLPWRDFIRDPNLAAVEQARGTVQLTQFPVEPIAAFFPAALDRTGRLEVQLDFDRGGNLEGSARIRGAALQPWPNGAVLRAIEADLVFDRREVKLSSLRAELSGKPVEASGRADFADWTNPTFDLAVKSPEIDLVREENLILRSGLDLRFERPKGEPALLAGTVTLKDSLWLQDITDFASRGPAGGGSTSPPYFKIEAQPFADWRLDLAVRGDAFLSVRSTLVEGRASARFDLTGTLGQPLLTGDASLGEEAAISFPFGSLGVEEARGFITADQPHTIQLSARAGGNSYGYQITLLVDGTASNPSLELTSVPPLPQDQILLMLTTGQQPQGEGGSGLAERGGRLAYYFGQDVFSQLFGGDQSSKISIHSGDTLSQFGETTTAVEYRLNDRFSLVGEYDEFNDYNLNLRWRFYRKGGEEAEEPEEAENAGNPSGGEEDADE